MMKQSQKFSSTQSENELSKIRLEREKILRDMAALEERKKLRKAQASQSQPRPIVKVPIQTEEAVEPKIKKIPKIPVKSFEEVMREAAEKEKLKKRQHSPAPPISAKKLKMSSDSYSNQTSNIPLKSINSIKKISKVDAPSRPSTSNGRGIVAQTNRISQPDSYPQKRASTSNISNDKSASSNQSQLKKVPNRPNAAQEKSQSNTTKASFNPSKGILAQSGSINNVHRTSTKTNDLSINSSKVAVKKMPSDTSNNRQESAQRKKPQQNAPSMSSQKDRGISSKSNQKVSQTNQGGSSKNNQNDRGIMSQNQKNRGIMSQNQKNRGIMSQNQNNRVISSQNNLNNNRGIMSQNNRGIMSQNQNNRGIASQNNRVIVSQSSRGIQSQNGIQAQNRPIARGIMAQNGGRAIHPGPDSDDDEEDRYSADSFIDDSGEELDERLVGEIYKSLRFDPTKYDRVSKHDDCRNMVSSAKQIQIEEAKSARIAREEDQKEARLEEERLKRKGKL